MGIGQHITPEMRKAAELWRERREARLASIQVLRNVDRQRAAQILNAQEGAENLSKMAEGYSEDISALIKKRQAAKRQARYRLAKAKRLAESA